VDAYLVSFPTFDDLKRVDGFRMGVPDSSAHMSVSIWKTQDVPHKFELQPTWVHVDGVPHTVRHFLGLWAVGSLIGTTLDVDLVSLRSRGVVRILVAMNEPKNLDKQNDTSRENLLCGAPKYAFCGAWVVLHRIFATKISILWRTSTCATELGAPQNCILVRHRNITGFIQILFCLVYIYRY
jgi:hypothetical protein